MKHKTVVKHFKKCGLTNAHYGAEDGALFDENESLLVTAVVKILRDSVTVETSYCIAFIGNQYL